MKNSEQDNYVKATREGRLYIKTSDFFKQAKIRETIEKLKNSTTVKQIDEKNRLAGTS